MKKILIVEDDPIVANIYRNKFLVEGYHVEIALDGMAGLNAFRAFRPNAVILDVVLSKVSGVDLIRQIRAEPECEKLPLIVFSSTYLTSKVQDAWKAGATKCLSKASCTPEQLIEVVSSCLQDGGLRAEPPLSKAQTFDGSLPAAPAPALSKTSAPALNSDAEFQADLFRSFVDGLPATLAALRAALQGLSKASDEPTRLQHVNDLYRRVHAVTGNAGIVGLQEIARMSDALEALLKDLYEKPRNLNASTLRTVASAIDFLGVLFERGVRQEQEDFLPPNILVVDDEEISRRAVTYAIEKAKFRAVSIGDPLAALSLLSEQAFDLIFLDVDMPGMNGFELCTKLRALPAHKTTPVVFVTSLNDFESRASSTISGGNDFIGKPFVFMELAVKATVHLLRGRLGALCADSPR
jgi:DNA-binding response OmpR family regulator